MKTCHFCGQNIDDHNSTCPVCGENPDADTARCPWCGETIEAGSNVCPYCAEPLDTAHTATAAPRPQAQNEQAYATLGLDQAPAKKKNNTLVIMLLCVLVCGLTGFGIWYYQEYRHLKEKLDDKDDRELYDYDSTEENVTLDDTAVTQIPDENEPIQAYEEESPDQVLIDGVWVDADAVESTYEEDTYTDLDSFKAACTNRFSYVIKTPSKDMRISGALTPNEETYQGYYNGYYKYDGLSTIFLVYAWIDDGIQMEEYLTDGTQTGFLQLFRLKQTDGSVGSFHNPRTGMTYPIYPTK